MFEFHLFLLLFLEFRLFETFFFTASQTPGTVFYLSSCSFIPETTWFSEKFVHLDFKLLQVWKLT